MAFRWGRARGSAAGHVGSAVWGKCGGLATYDTHRPEPDQPSVPHRQPGTRAIRTEARARMRIIAHSGASEWGGAEIALTDLLLGLEGRGHDVSLFVNRTEVLEGARGRGITSRRVPLGGDVAPLDAVLLSRTLRAERPDVLLAGTFKRLRLAAWAARMAGVPRVVARVGMVPDLPAGPTYAFVLKRWVDRVVFVADETRQSYVRRLPELADRFVTIHKGVPPQGVRWSPREARRAFGLPEDIRLVGSVGRLLGKQRFDRLLEAMVFLPRDVHLAIVGEGPLRGALGRRAEVLKLRPRVYFLGHCGNIGAFMDALDILVITSDRESTADAMLEAMSRGVPVVSTDVTGAREALRAGADGQTPGLLTGSTPPQIASAMNSMLGDPRILDAMGGAAASLYRERFSFDDMLDAWEAVLTGP